MSVQKRKRVEFEEVLASARQLPLQEQLRLFREMLRELELALAPEEGAGVPRRPLYGLWKGFTITEEDIEEARREMWGDFGEREV